MYTPRKILLKYEKDVQMVRDFLETFQLTYNPYEVDYTLALMKGDDIFATGSIKGEVIRNVAVRSDEQGQGLSSMLITKLLQEQVRRGVHHNFVFTKPANTEVFKFLSFKEIARVEPYVALMENGVESIDSFCNDLRKQLPVKKGKRAALVMNCNPFTLGHKSLIEKASKENDSVVVFVVSEDLSVFPFEKRFCLVKKGVQELENVTVLPGGKYMVSQATFPTYFTHGEDAVVAQTRLDITIFGKHIAKACDIDIRYVGEEPYCQVTNAYNRAMEEILPRYDVSLNVVKRSSIEDEIISASKVREAIKQDDWQKVKTMVPETTYEALQSEDMKSIIDQIKESESRH